MFLRLQSITIASCAPDHKTCSQIILESLSAISLLKPMADKASDGVAFAP